MAKKPAKGAARGKGGKGGGMAGMFMIIGLSLVLLMIVSMPSVIIIVFGMLPAFVAMLIDRTPQKFAMWSVFAMNFAGVFPSLLELWLGSNTMGTAIDIMTNVFSLFIMYGAAALGWALFTATPPMVTGVLEAIAQRRIKNLQAEQESLVEEWGDEVKERPEEPVAPGKKGAKVSRPGAPRA